MKTCSPLIILFTAAVAGILAEPAIGQQKRASPHETISARVNKKLVTITYGRPLAKGRKIFGGLVPYDTAWRAGSDEATTLISDIPLTFGSVNVPAGTAVTLYTIPSEKGKSKLAISKHVGQWGIPVDQKNDIGRVDMKTDKLPMPVEQFTMAIEPSKDGGAIKMMWETTQYTVPFTVGK